MFFSFGLRFLHTLYVSEEDFSLFSHFQNESHLACLLILSFFVYMSKFSLPMENLKIRFIHTFYLYLLQLHNIPISFIEFFKKARVLSFPILFFFWQNIVLGLTSSFVRFWQDGYVVFTKEFYVLSFRFQVHIN